MSPVEVKMTNAYLLKGLVFELSNTIAGTYHKPSFAFGEQTVASYWVLDFGVAYSLELGKTELGLELLGTNLLNKAYTTHYNWNGITRMGRNIVLSANWKF
jgi:outer membrane receptor protein involved in Fe transport